MPRSRVRRTPHRRPALGFLLLLALALLAAPRPAAAQQSLTTLFTTMDVPFSVQGVDSVPVGPSPLGTFRQATSFTPKTTGDAQLVSIRGRCVVPYPTGTTCQGVGEVSIQADQGGKPSGTSLGTMGFYLSDSLTSGTPVKKECGSLSPAVHLVAGTKYWAVMSAPDQIGWDDWTNAGSQVLESIDGGAWTAGPNQKTLSLRIDGGSSTCVPKADANPVSGTTIGEMYVHSAAKTFNTITVSNGGVAPLTIGGYTLTGAGASAFSVMDSEPGPLAKAYKFPHQVGVGGLSFLYVTCTGTANEGWSRATLTLQTNDPDKRELSYPLECLTDNTPPKVSFSGFNPDGKNGWFVTPAKGNVMASDPESGDRVIQTFCTRGANEYFLASSSVLSVEAREQGSIGLACRATDLARNTSATVVKVLDVDTQAPVVTPKLTPAPTADGWNNTTTSVGFDCADPTPGSGVDRPVTGGGTVIDETAGTDFTSSGCTDIAGNASKAVTATVRIDKTAPAIASAGVTPAPNAAGWNRTDATVAFDCADRGTVRSGIKTDTVPDVPVTAETSGLTVISTGHCADKAANEAAVATQLVKLDKTEPTTTVDSGPAAITTATTAQVGFAGADARSGMAGLECSLDGAGYAACTSPRSLSGLADGSHTLSVRAVDVAGNTDSTPATRTWTIDTAAPQTMLSASPADVTADRTAAFRYAGDTLGGTAIAGYECRLDGAAFAACPNGGRDYAGLAAGNHRFEVRAIDAAGNADGTPMARTWTIDLTAPVTTISGTPNAVTGDTTATFAFSAADTGGSTVAGYECRVDAGAFAPCTSGARYTGLALGTHTFQVRATDKVGNVEAAAASYSWRIASFFAVADQARTEEDTSVDIDVAANDVGSQLTIAPSGASVRGGTVTKQAGGKLRYDPPADFNGTDTFEYTATGGATTTNATVTVEVAAVNDAPAFTAGDAVDADGPYAAAWASAIVAGPADEASQKLHFVVSEPSDPGMFSASPAISPTGQLTFTPAPGASGVTTVDVRLVDDGGGNDASEAAPLKITLRPAAQPASGPADTQPAAGQAAGVQADDQAPTLAVAGGLRCGRGGTLRLKLGGPAATLSGASSDKRVKVAFAGSGADRTVTVTPGHGVRRASVTLRANAGGHSAPLVLRLAVGTARADRLRGGAGTDLLFGGAGSDRISGAGGADLVCGGAGRDRLDGGAGADVLSGDAGADRLDGGAGDDVLSGGAGRDRVRGGAGADVFVRSPGRDTLVDFGPGDRR